MNTGQASENVNEYRKNKEYKIPARQVCKCENINEYLENKYV